MQLWTECNKCKKRFLAECNSVCNDCKTNIDAYAGDLNKKRIKKYRFLAEKYNIDENIAMHIFCDGIDWYKSIVEK